MNTAERAVVVKTIAEAVHKVNESYSHRLGAVEGVLIKELVDLKAAVAAKAERGEPGKNADPQEVAKIVIEGLSPDALFSSKEFTEILARIQEQVRTQAESRLDPVMQERVSKAVEALPKALDGAPGKNAFDVAVSLGFQGTVHDWMDSLRGEKGQDSAVTAEQFIPLFEAQSVKALLDFERRAQDVLQKAIDRIPTPANGKDGLGFDDLEVIHDGERQFTLRFVRGDVVKEFPFKIPALLERGVYRAGKSYEKGDCVSYGGSLWIAQRDTDSKPEADDSFRLAVKRGRDGKDGDPGKKGDPGDRGKSGKDLTQLGPDGSKWG